MTIALLEKVYMLFKRGATSGERSAAEARLLALLPRFGFADIYAYEQHRVARGLDVVQDESVRVSIQWFPYSTNRDKQFLIAAIRSITGLVSKLELIKPDNPRAKKRGFKCSSQQFYAITAKYELYKYMYKKACEKAFLDTLRVAVNDR